MAIADLIEKAKVKFDWHVDPIQLGSQFVKAEEVKDYPRMIISVPDNEWRRFFVTEAKKLKEQIIKDE